MNKKVLFIIGIALIGLCSLVVTVIIFMQTQNRPLITPPPVPPTSYPNVGEVPLQDLKSYNYSLITSEDTIKIKTPLNEELLINLDKKNWHEISWSQKGSYIAALGQTQNNVFNLFIYNISTQKWIQATQFGSENVTSYQWIDNDTLFFTSGGWLHRYKYSSQNEIVKIYQTSADIISISPNRSTVLLKDQAGVFTILSSKAELLFKLDNIIVAGTTTVIPIQQAYYNKDSQSLLFIANGAYYHWKMGDKEAKNIAINTEGQNLDGLAIVCSQEVDTFKTYRVESGVLKLSDFNLNTTLVSTLVEKEVPSGEAPGSTMCTGDDKLEFYLDNNGKKDWYELKGDKLERLVILDNAKEASIR